MTISIPAQAAQVDQQPMRARVIAASVIGNSLEWYDFTIYAFLATIISKHFFPSSTDTVALLSTVA
jgi:MHS family proline/betaine transporter-like MFS transporter